MADREINIRVAAKVDPYGFKQAEESIKRLSTTRARMVDAYSGDGFSLRGDQRSVIRTGEDASFRAAEAEFIRASRSAARQNQLMAGIPSSSGSADMGAGLARTSTSVSGILDTAVKLGLVMHGIKGAIDLISGATQIWAAREDELAGKFEKSSREYMSGIDKIRRISLLGVPLGEIAYGAADLISGGALNGAEQSLSDAKRIGDEADARTKKHNDLRISGEEAVRRMREQNSLDAVDGIDRIRREEDLEYGQRLREIKQFEKNKQISSETARQQEYEAGLASNRRRARIEAEHIREGDQILEEAERKRQQQANRGIEDNLRRQREAAEQSVRLFDEKSHEIEQLQRQRDDPISSIQEAAEKRRRQRNQIIAATQSVPFTNEAFTTGRAQLMAEQYRSGIRQEQRADDIETSKNTKEIAEKIQTLINLIIQGGLEGIVDFGG